MTHKNYRDFLALSAQRGYTHQITDESGLVNRLASGPITAYLGFDATAKSLHVGNLVQVMRLRLLQQTGNKPIVLMGGGTTRVGDPSGKDDMRQMLTNDVIDDNIAGISRVFSKYLTFGDGASDAMLVNNADWLTPLSYMDFLRDYGRHFSINRMIGFDSVRLRLEREQFLSFLEFNYMILQAYDFLELYKRYGVQVQLGGSDQWGNIVCGIDLVRRVAGAESFGITSHLITTSSGAKMGKSAKGAVWLDSDLLSSFDFWQFWRNTDDADVGRFLRLFTDLPLVEIARLETLQGSEMNAAKKILASNVTALCHGKDAAEAAENAASGLFDQAGQSVEHLLNTLHTVVLDRTETASPISLVDVLVRAGLASSKGDARRLIQGGGARINDIPQQSVDYCITQSDWMDCGIVKVSAGRKKHALLRIE